MSMDKTYGGRTGTPRNDEPTEKHYEGGEWVYSTCPNCRGQANRQVSLGSGVSYTERCPQCNGRGQVREWVRDR